MYKVTLPAPSNFFIAGWVPGITDAVYADRAEVALDLARIIRREIEALIDEGTPYIQLDAPYYCALLEDESRERLRRGGVDPGRALSEMIAADNAAIEGLGGGEVTIAVHMCRGNSRSRWLTEGGYDAIAESLFNQLSASRLLLEYDSARAGDFTPLRFVPSDKTVVLGLVTTKDGGLESESHLCRRINSAARCLPLDQLALSPQCGFASVAAGNVLSEEDQWRKLELVVHTAQQVWKN
jgi:5-methyltetrahydropteroyltriglutamate--homocysteine methyltransferase